MTYLILLADGLHNFVGGLAIGASFLVSVHVAVVTWVAAAAHEVPQKLGDFGILIRGGRHRTSALVADFVHFVAFTAGMALIYVTRAIAEGWVTG